MVFVVLMRKTVFAMVTYSELDKEMVKSYIQFPNI